VRNLLLVATGWTRYPLSFDYPSNLPQTGKLSACDYAMGFRKDFCIHKNIYFLNVYKEYPVNVIFLE